MDVAAAPPVKATTPAVTRRAIATAVRAGLAALSSVPPVRLADWAREHMVLAGDSSHQRGRWELWPFQEGLLDWMGDDEVEELDVRKSKRVGYTKCLAASVAFDAVHKHRNQAVWQPTDDDRDSFVATEIEPLIDLVGVVRRAQRLTKGTREKIAFKRFLHSVAHFLGGKAARAYRRITVASVKLDELDGFDREIEKAGDPFSLAHGRLEGAPFPKAICGTTPREKGASHIEHRESLAQVAMRYHIVCPHCEVEHPLLRRNPKVAHGFKWRAGEPASAHHVCPHCRGSITQGQYRAAWRGAWVCERTGIRYGPDRTWRNAAGEPIRAPRHVSAHVWAAYSPQRTWASIATECEAAETKKKAGDPGPIKVFINETEGELYTPDAEQTDASALRARLEAYPLRRVPKRALILFSGVDVQDDRLVAVTAGFGRDEECWVVDDRVMPGSAGDWKTWTALDTYLATRFPHEGGQTCAIDAVAIDTGGHFTHMVYRYAMLREARRVYATKGSSQDGKPIVAGPPSRVDVNADGQVIKDGCKLWHVGTGTAKDLLHHRLQVLVPGAGYIHLSRELPGEFIDELTAEVRVQQRTARGMVSRWAKPTAGTRNERLDCFTGIFFCAARFKLAQYTDAEWLRLEQALCPPTADLFRPPVPEPLPAEAPAAAEAELAAAGVAGMAEAGAPVWGGQRGRRVLSRGVA